MNAANPRDQEQEEGTFRLFDYSPSTDAARLVVTHPSISLHGIYTYIYLLWRYSVLNKVEDK